MTGMTAKEVDQGISKPAIAVEQKRNSHESLDSHFVCELLPMGFSEQQNESYPAAENNIPETAKKCLSVQFNEMDYWKLSG